MTELRELAGELFVHRLGALSQVPFQALQDLGQSSFWTLSVTPDEVSLVAPALTLDGLAVPVGPWSGFRVAGQLDFGLTGVLHALTEPLARAAISVFAISTYDTDCLLVRAETRGAAIHAWRASQISVVETAR